jgi:hypothetical protein
MIVRRLLLSGRLSLRIQDPDLLVLVALGGQDRVEAVHEPILIELLDLNLVSRGILVVEAEHFVHQGVAGVSVAMGTVRPGLGLCLDVEGVGSVARFLLPGLGMEALAGSHLAAVSLLGLALLIRCDLKEVIGVALLLMTGWEVLIVCFLLLHLKSVSFHDVRIESRHSLKYQLLGRLLFIVDFLL